MANTAEGRRTVLAYQAELTIAIREHGRFARQLWLAAMRAANGDPEQAWAQVSQALEQREAAIIGNVTSLTAAYVPTLANLEGEPSTPVVLAGAAEYLAPVLRGVDPVDYRRRPLVDLYSALGRGEDYSRAVEIGAARVQSNATTAVQMAARQSQVDTMDAQPSRLAGFRRTLSGAENCALCITAATQRYHRAELQPIHPGCDCGIEPIYSDQPVPRTIDAVQTETIIGGERTTIPSSRILNPRPTLAEGTGGVPEGGVDSPSELPEVAVYEHGEMGPTLRVATDNVTTL